MRISRIGDESEAGYRARRVLGRIVVDDGCWRWIGAHHPQGYGTLKPGRSKLPGMAHRAVWEVLFGPIPIGLDVCHTCDNPGCVNPAHLWLGTHGDNMRDMIRKGRRVAKSGPAHHNARLTTAEVVALRLAAWKIPSRDAALLFGVSKVTILNIWNGIVRTKG